jgi:hypothetical protein
MDFADTAADKAKAIQMDMAVELGKLHQGS